MGSTPPLPPKERSDKKTWGTNPPKPEGETKTDRETRHHILDDPDPCLSMLPPPTRPATDPLPVGVPPKPIRPHHLTVVNPSERYKKTNGSTHTKKNGPPLAGTAMSRAGAQAGRVRLTGTDPRPPGPIRNCSSPPPLYGTSEAL